MTERLSGAVLEITAPIDGTDRTGVFELRKDFEGEPELTKNFIIGPTGEVGARVLNLVSGGDAGGNRRPYVVDAGGGQLAYSLRATLSPTKHNGTYLQMGDTGDAGNLTVGDATGASGRDQADMLLEYATASTTDSVSPATLHVGHHHDGTYSDSGEAGIFGSPRNVYIREARPVATAEEPSSVDFAITAILTGTLAETIDAAEQLT